MRVKGTDGLVPRRGRGRQKAEGVIAMAHNEKGGETLKSPLPKQSWFGRLLAKIAKANAKDFGGVPPKCH